MKGNSYKRNPFGKFAGDYMSKADFVKKVNRKNRRIAKAFCKSYV